MTRSPKLAAGLNSGGFDRWASARSASGWVAIGAAVQGLAVSEGPEPVVELVRCEVGGNGPLVLSYGPAWVSLAQMRQRREFTRALDIGLHGAQWVSSIVAITGTALDAGRTTGDTPA
jgi:hypothetical protein